MTTPSTFSKHSMGPSVSHLPGQLNRCFQPSWLLSPSVQRTSLSNTGKLCSVSPSRRVSSGLSPEQKHMAPARTDHSAAIHSADGPHKDPDAQGGGKLGGGARREDLVVKGAKGQGIESIFLAFPPPSHCPPAASCTSHSPRVSERLWLSFALKASAPWL